MAKLVAGIGINDADYPIFKTIGGKREICPYYRKWADMLNRAYKLGKHSYISCEVCDEWLTFSNFKRWMEEQDWEGKQLDKDLLGDGKLYSPDTCCFIDSKANSFLTTRRAGRGNYPLGVRRKPGCRFEARVNDGSGRPKSLGYFGCATAAHLAWKAAKRRQAIILGESLGDSRITNLLVSWVDNTSLYD